MHRLKIGGRSLEIGISTRRTVCFLTNRQNKIRFHEKCPYHFLISDYLRCHDLGMPSRKKRIFSSAPLAGRRSHRRGRPGYDEFRGADLRTQRHFDSSAGQRLPPQHPFQGRLVRPQGRVAVRDRAAALRSANGPQHGRSPASRSGNDRRQTELRPGQTAGRDQRRQQKRSGPGRRLASRPPAPRSTQPKPRSTTHA